MSVDISDSLFRAIEAGTLGHQYCGVSCIKNPIDLMILGRLLWDVKPRTIIEVGSWAGGSALWMRDQMRSYGVDCVVRSVDVKVPSLRDQENLHFYLGDGRDLGATFSDEFMGQCPHPLFVIDDADHQPETTVAVLDFFDRHSRPGEYVVVEDGDADKYYPGTYRGGPLAGVRSFLERRGGDYEIDRRYCDMFGWTGSPDGYIRRVR